jgi:hypothetical protein
MSRFHVAVLLRALSYGALLVAIGWMVFEKMQPARPACHTMSCMGSGIGEAIVLIFVLGSSFLLGALLNTTSFWLQGAPRSVARKLELWVLFVVPLGLILALAGSFML